MPESNSHIAFSGETRVASGSLEGVLTQIKARLENDPREMILIFENETGRQIDFDFSGTLDQVLLRAIPEHARNGPGRPKLGVVSREISLLPRHWDWLEEQPNGASAALRRLVDQARNQDAGTHRARLSIDATNRFLSAMAGNLPGYEEATRALYARNREHFERHIRDWPADIRIHTLDMARTIFE